MPNHIYNTVTIDGEEDIVELLDAAVRSEERSFDFSKIVPPPSIIEQVTPGDLSLKVQGEHPHRNWYEWQIAYWGAKWNAFDLQEAVPGRYEFSTAWNPPIPVVRTLSALFPELSIKMIYQEEGEGFNGRVVFEDGEVVEGSID